MQKLIGNAFSMGMLDCFSQGEVSVKCRLLSDEEARAWVSENTPASCVGHADTAALFTNLLGQQVACARVSASLAQGDQLLVGQLTGPRLPEGAVSLPEGARIRWILTEVV